MKSAVSFNPADFERAVLSVAAVDDTKDVLDSGPQLAQVLGRDRDLTAGRDHVLDNEHPAPGDLAPLGQFGGAVALGSLANQDGMQARREREGGRDRDPAELETCEHFGVHRDQRDQMGNNRIEKIWVNLELILVEVIVGELARAEGETAGESAALVDDCGKGLFVHRPPVWRGPTHLARKVRGTRSPRA